jgi:hypothetical protein
MCYLAIIALACVVLQDAISADAVLCTQLLPELAANLVAALPYLQRDDLSWHGLLLVQERGITASFAV